jgi:type I restriction enzyme R subunit
MTSDAYLSAEAARPRVDIDCQLVAYGWAVQGRTEMNLYAGQRAAVQEFIMAPGHGRVDYLLSRFTLRQAARRPGQVA